MRTKLVLLPLDERPCNFYFPERLFSDETIEIVKPERLGNKKVPADFKEIKSFLLEECRDADGLVISFDQLLYGGLVPSRIHKDSREKLCQRLEVIKEIRDQNPKLLIYGFNVIMRCPNYSSDDEEPDYYLFCGKEIHDLGVAVHKTRNGVESGNAVEKAMELVDKKILEDYICRRELNRSMNLEILELLRKQMVDGLVIPQDDSAEYGYAAMDQKLIREKIAEYKLSDTVLIYPGADEVELTLLSRMLNRLKKRQPVIFPKYFSEGAKKLIPLYEGNPLAQTVDRHILSAGCQKGQSEEEADIILYLTAPSVTMREAVVQPEEAEDYKERDLQGLLDSIRVQKEKGKITIIADNAYANGGDLKLIDLLNENKMLLSLDGYAGWNTSANTIGTAIAEGVYVYHFGKSEKYERFMMERYLEDGGYCGKIRGEVTENLPETGMSYFDVKDKKGIVSFIIADRLKEYMHGHLNSMEDKVGRIHVTMPWKRMFEIDLEVEP